MLATSGGLIGVQALTDNLNSILATAKATCAEQGVKLTSKRENVLTCIISSDEAISPYELAEIYKEQYGQTMPAMSVYRILDFLVELSLVHKLTSANKYIACSHISCSHSHQSPQFLICENCQSVKEIGINHSVLEQLKDSVEKTGFVLTTQQIELKGLCKNCQ